MHAILNFIQQIVTLTFAGHTIKVQSLKHNLSYQILAAAGSLLFPLLSFPYITRTLGPAMLGKVNYVDFLAGLIISLTYIGIPLYGVREIARYRYDAVLRRRSLESLLRIHLISAALGCVGFVLFLNTHPRYANEKGLIFMGVVYILTHVLAAEWYLQGIEAFPFISIRTIVLRASSIVAIFLFIRQPGDYLAYYAIVAMTMLLTMIVNFTRIKPSLAILKPSANDKNYLPGLLYFFMASTFISIYDYIDTVMLGWLSQDENVGFYTAAMKLVRLSLLLILSINVILFPRLSHLLAEKKEEETALLLQKSISFIITAAVPGMILYLVLAPELISLFAGQRYEPSVPVIRWLSALPLVIALSNLWLLYYLSSFHQHKTQIIWLVTSALFIGLSVNYWLIPVYQEQGAAIASLCSETFIMLFLGISQKIKIPLKPLWQSILASALFIPLTWLIRNIFTSPAETLFTIFFSSVLVYLLVQSLIFKNEVVMAIFNYAKQIIQKLARPR